MAPTQGAPEWAEQAIKTTKSHDMVTPMTAWALVDLINRLICYRLFKTGNSKTQVGKPKFMVLIGYPCLDTFGCLKANKGWNMSIPEGCEAIGSPGCCFGRRFQHLGIQTLGSEMRIGHFTRHAWKWNKGEGKGMKTAYVMLCTILHMDICKYVI